MKYSALVFLFIFQGVVFTEEVDQSLNTVAVDDDIIMKDSNGTALDKGNRGGEQNDTAVEGKIATALEEEIEKLATQIYQDSVLQNDTQMDQDSVRNDTQVYQVSLKNDTQVDQNIAKNDTVTTAKDDNNTTMDGVKMNPLSLGTLDEEENCTDSEEELRGDMGHELSGQEGEKSNSSNSTTPPPTQQPFACPYARRRQRPRGRFPRPRPINNYFIFNVKKDRRKGVTVTGRCYGGHHCSSFNDRNGFDHMLQLNNPYSAILRVAALRIA